MRIFPALLVVLALTSSAQAAPSDSHDFKNSKQYGNCLVTTTVDMLTDEEQHYLLCREGDSVLDRMALTINSSPLENSAVGYSVTLGAGLQIHMEEDISVAIRIDKGPLIKRNAIWMPQDGEYAHILGFDGFELGLALLKDLPNGQRVAIQVGAKRGHIRLEGSAQAVDEFLRRIAPPQQTLTVPTQPQDTLTPEQRHNLHPE